MRINSNDPIASQLLTENSVRSGKSSKVSNGASSAGSGASLPGDTANLGSLTALAMQTPDVRQDRVSALREAVRNGSYQLDPGKIADAMLQESSR